MQYRCKNENRRQAVREHPSLNGIDFLEVLDQEAPTPIDPADPNKSLRQRTLLVYGLKPIPALTQENAEIQGGVRITPVQIVWAYRADLIPNSVLTAQEQAFFTGLLLRDRIFVIRTDTAGDYSSYRLVLKQPTNDEPPVGFDRQLRDVEFSFKVECSSEFDCQEERVCPPQLDVEPAIDYLAKDYQSFRRLMLDRLSVILPEWQERNPADLGIALVEVLAYAADHLSYHQDAVATEAYLGTARQRVSLRRHARLLDYAMHEGCNARTWVTVEVNATADGAVLLGATTNQGGTLLLTNANEPGGVLPIDRLPAALNAGARVFETMHDLTLYQAHNLIHFYTWGDDQCCLPKGATRATLKDDPANRLHLRAGDVLIFEEQLSPITGLSFDANPLHRHAVRLIGVKPEAKPEKGANQWEPSNDPQSDSLNNQAYVEIEWHLEDALPFPLCLSTIVEDQVIEAVSIVRGNVVLADFGQTIPEEALQPSIVPSQGHYRPQLQRQGITYRVPYDPAIAPTQSAKTTLKQDPRQALPAVALQAEGEFWTVQRDLLASDRFAADFVVELEADGRASLRFGDGILGRRAVSGLVARYRIGNGTDGNVGADAIAHIVTALSGIQTVRNPLTAIGGTVSESLEQVRLYAPEAFRVQERAVTEADYAAIAQRHPQVQKAAATLRWTGSWHTMFVTIDRQGGKPVNAEFKAEMQQFLDRFRLAGQDVEIDSPQFVALDLALTVCVAPGYFRSDVKRALLETFSSGELPNGRRGFFHPDQFTFHQPLYLSQVVATAMQVPGVRWVDTDDTSPKLNRFQRWGQFPNGELAAGKISCDRLEILRLDNDPNAPENGKLEFFMEGGT